MRKEKFSFTYAIILSFKTLIQSTLRENEAQINQDPRAQPVVDAAFGKIGRATWAR